MDERKARINCTQWKALGSASHTRNRDPASDSDQNIGETGSDRGYDLPDTSDSKIIGRRAGSTRMTGSELKQIRKDLGHAIGRSLSAADMAKLCGLAPGDGPDTIRKWEVKGPSGPAAELLRILAMASDRYPILENFNVFDRFNIDEKDRPARREAFRENMRDEVRRRLG